MASLADLLDYDQRKKQLLSAVQAGTDVINRGTIAGTLGTPVDLANTALQAVGLGSEKPVLGSEWIGDKMQQAGMVSPERRPVAEFAAGFINPETAATKGAMLAKALASKTAPLHAMMVFHGTPHKFENFDASKIGTGEGAQAYGHGIYVAENPDVAKSYQPRSPEYEEKLLKKYNQAESRRDYETMEVLEDAMIHKTPDEIVARFSDLDEGYTPKHAKAAQDFATWYSKNTPEVGSLLRVDLPDAHIERMLDWDKTFTEQPQSVQKALKDYAVLSGMTIDPKMTGSSIYDLFGKVATKGKDLSFADFKKIQQAASEQLRWAGIPGIKYLEEGSKGIGKGTRNFVVFPGEEQNLKILKRE